MGVDTQTTDFTVAGIGDMSGDVFGNGMLLSRHIRLVAAFDHRHIFLDPDPDAAASFAERERLFELPRSSWADYDAKLISAGGGVHPRSAKSIALTPEVQGGARRSPADALTPTELVNAILKAPVDLLYNGGIGTYVKATGETHAQVGDRANDALRVNGRELRCKVVVEGGNLGCTQLGRIEYRAGRRAHQHRRDRQLGRRRHLRPRGQHQDPARAGDRRRRADREAAQRAARGDDRRGRGARAARQLLPDAGAVGDRAHRAAAARRAGALHRSSWRRRAGSTARIEFLPDDEEIAERARAGTGLASPERAVLLAYSKIWLYDELLASPLPDDPWVATALARYFPAAAARALRRATWRATR